MRIEWLKYIVKTHSKMNTIVKLTIHTGVALKKSQLHLEHKQMVLSSRNCERLMAGQKSWGGVKLTSKLGTHDLFHAIIKLELHVQ